jgi:type II secretory pathway pseudopilin PulG
MRRHISTQRFTVIELIVVISVIMVLLALVAPALKRARDRSLQATCISNVRDISLAIQLYHNDHEAYPAWEHLDASLASYRTAAAEDAWHCPKTEEPYGLFYVPRGVGEEMDSRFPAADNYFLGCPYHKVVNFAAGKGTDTYTFGWVKHDGVDIACGDEIEDGLLEFSDGSTARVNGRVMVLTSFRNAEGGVYTILKVFRNYGSTTINVSVPPSVSHRSKLEVVTPAGIAGVVGTVFEVNYQRAGPQNRMSVQVTSGTVDVTSAYERPVRAHGGGPPVWVRVPRFRCGNIPPSRPARNYRIPGTRGPDGDDDDDDDGDDDDDS